MLNNVTNENWINYCNALKISILVFGPALLLKSIIFSPYEVVKKINANIK